MVPFDSYELQNCKSDRISETPDFGRGSPVAAPTAVRGESPTGERLRPAPFNFLRNLTVPLIEITQDYGNGTRLPIYYHILFIKKTAVTHFVANGTLSKQPFAMHTALAHQIWWPEPYFCFKPNFAGVFSPKPYFLEILSSKL